jgi:hypothetical protein
VYNINERNVVAALLHATNKGFLIPSSTAWERPRSIYIKFVDFYFWERDGEKNKIIILIQRWCGLKQSTFLTSGSLLHMHQMMIYNFHLCSMLITCSAFRLTWTGTGWIAPPFNRTTQSTERELHPIKQRFSLSLSYRYAYVLVLYKFEIDDDEKVGRNRIKYLLVVCIGA